MPGNDSNREHIGRFYDFLNHSSHGVTELVVIDPNNRGGIRIGYFDNREDFVDACVAENGNGNIYASVNPCPREHIDRAPNELRRLPSRVRTDDIQWVTAIPLDVDPRRPAGTASTQTEMEEAVDRANDIVEYLVEEGICAPCQAQIVMTGNGCHVLIPIPPMEVTDDNRDDITARKKQFEQIIRDRYADDTIEVDSIHDLPRIIKVAGTLSIKGQDTSDRPHRVSSPVTSLERHESSELRDYILNLEIDSSAPPSPPEPPPDITLPTDLDDEPPCGMCEAATTLWNTQPPERSTPTFVMMQVLVAKGMGREDAIAYTMEYDRKIGGKYTSRDDGGLTDINRMYTRVTNGRTKVNIPCSWLRGHGYCRKSASECDDECRGGPRWRRVVVSAEEVELDTRTLEEVREELRGEISEIEVRTGPRTHLITYPSGAGKTHQVAEHVRIRGWKVLWMCATHKHAQETRRKHFPGMNVVELSSRARMIEDGKLDCPRRKDIKRVSEVSPESTAQVCSRCYRKLNRECEYYTNLEDAKDADIIIVMHAHLQIPGFLRKYMDDVDCIVINEDASKYYRKECTFSTSDVESSISILEEMRESSIVSEEVSDTAAELIEYHRDFLGRDDDRFRLGPLPNVSEDFREIYDIKFLSGRSIWVNDDTTLRTITAGQLPEPKEDVLRVFLHVSQDDSISITRHDGEYTYIRSVELPADVDVLMLDATGRKVTYEAMLGREVTVYGEDCYIDQVVHVTQFLDGTYPTSSLVRNDERTTSYHRVKKLVESIIDKHQGKRILIATMKTVEELMDANGILDNPDTEIDTEHYYDMRGLDEYGYHDVLIVVGNPMISYEDIAEEARILYNQEWDDAEMVQQMKEDGKEYRRARYSVDGMGWEVETYKFSNPYVQLYYESIVEAEVIQMVGRIRPYAGDTKNVYLINNTPLSNLKVDQMITIDDFMAGEDRPRERGIRSERRNTKEAIDSMSDKFKIPDLMAELGLPSEPEKYNTERDSLRSLLRRNLDYFQIEFHGHTIRKRPSE